MRVSTDLIEIDQENPSPEAIARAAAVIRKGGVVAIPTDALYMLVADPFNLHAVAKCSMPRSARYTARFHCW